MLENVKSTLQPQLTITTVAITVFHPQPESQWHHINHKSSLNIIRRGRLYEDRWNKSRAVCKVRANRKQKPFLTQMVIMMTTLSISNSGLGGRDHLAHR